MPVKLWNNIIAPHEDLREGKPLDASEFAVHLDQVREGRDQRCWRRAQALSALYPDHTEENRWVDGVLARKK